MRLTTATTAAVAVAIAAASAPSAADATVTRSPGAGPPSAGSSIRFDLNTSRQGVATGLGQAQNASPFVRPNADEQMPQASDSGAGRRQSGDHPGGYSRPDKSIIAISSPPSAAMVAKASVPQAAVRIQTPPSGFDWGDGAIGALVVLGVMAVGCGATVLMRRRTSSLARTES